MARLYFHLSDVDDRLVDPEGREIDDTTKIGELALYEARALLSEDVLNGRLELRRRLDVEDGAGTLVHSLEFGDAIEILYPSD